MDVTGRERGPDGRGLAGALPSECPWGVWRREGWFPAEAQFLLLSLPGEKKMGDE